MEWNGLSCPKTKAQLNKYNLCVEQLKKARKVYKARVHEYEEVWDECAFLRNVFNSGKLQGSISLLIFIGLS